MSYTENQAIIVFIVSFSLFGYAMFLIRCPSN
jgi:hypothetical protein